MSVEQALARINEAMAGLQRAREELTINTHTIVPNGVNLAAHLVGQPDNAIVTLAPDFVWEGALEITKPVSINGGRIVGRLPKPTAPNVHLRNMTIESNNAAYTLVTLSPRMLLEDVRLVGTALGQRRAIEANSTDNILRRVTTRNIFSGSESQGIAGWSGTKTLLIEDCDIEASGESIIFGGSDPDQESNIPRDIIVRGTTPDACYLSKDISWRNNRDITCKNIFELKNSKNVLVENVKMKYSWNSGQIGFGIVLTTRNQYGAAPWSTIEDTIFRNINMSDCAGGVQIQGMDNTFPSQVLKRLLFENFHVTNINPALYGLNGRCLQMGRGGDDITFNNFSFEGQNLNSIITFAGSYGLPPMNRLTFNNGRFPTSQYGIQGEGPARGLATLNAYAPNQVWTNMTVGRATEALNVWPTGTNIIV